jgi:hypothetical protein
MRRGTKFTIMVIAAVGSMAVLANGFASSVNAANYSTLAEYNQARETAARGSSSHPGGRCCGGDRPESAAT